MTLTFGDVARAIEHRFDRPANDKWRWSPFAWMRRLPSAKKHEAAKLMLRRWLKAQEFAVRSLKHRSASYLKINGHLVSLKVSFEWDECLYMFQQIRQEPYEYAMLAGISPARVRLWTVPRNEQNLFVTPQHIGPKGPANHLVRVRVDDIPKWLRRYRGIETLR